MATVEAKPVITAMTEAIKHTAAEANAPIVFFPH